MIIKFQLNARKCGECSSRAALSAAPAADDANEDAMTPEEIGLARALRIAIISQQVKIGNLTVEQGKELLRGPLTPGDNSTIIDDSEQLITDESIERDAYARGWKAGARAMKELCKAKAMRFIDIPEPPPEEN